jgi:hypothetical protein
MECETKELLLETLVRTVPPPLDLSELDREFGLDPSAAARKLLRFLTEDDEFNFERLYGGTGLVFFGYALALGRLYPHLRSDAQIVQSIRSIAQRAAATDREWASLGGTYLLKLVA